LNHESVTVVNAISAAQGVDNKALHFLGAVPVCDDIKRPKGSELHQMCVSTIR